jgi:hypothetical protein
MSSPVQFDIKKSNGYIDIVVDFGAVIDAMGLSFDSSKSGHLRCSSLVPITRFPEIRINFIYPYKDLDYSVFNERSSLS